MFPLGLALCENELQRDLTFLKSFAGKRVDLRVTPLHGGRLDAKAARLLHGQAEAARRVGLVPRAIIVHHDVDTSSLTGRRTEIEAWFEEHRLDRLGCRLVPCTPRPCTERWLCGALGIAARNGKPSAGCGPWKKAWSRGSHPDLDRVRAAAERARERLRSLPDFDAFLRAWTAAGTEPAPASA